MLIGLIKIIGIKLILYKASIIIIIKLIYNLSLYTQVLKRAYYLGQKEDIYYYILYLNILIKRVVKEKQVKKSKFLKDTFKTVEEAKAKDSESSSKGGGKRGSKGSNNSNKDKRFKAQVVKIYQIYFNKSRQIYNYYINLYKLG